MDKFVTRAPTWKTMTYSTAAATTIATKVTGRASLSAKNPTKSQMNPLKENNINIANSQNKRLSIRDEKLLQLLTTTPDEPLICSGSCSNSSMESGYFRCVTPTNERNNNANLTATVALNIQSTKIATPSKASDYLSCSEAPSQNILVSEAEANANVPYENLLYDDLNMAPRSPLKVQHANTVFDRIKNDINSPSASVRLRAMKALKNSQNYAAYSVFDVPHDEQSIITAEERRPPQLPSIQDIMKDVVIYVEVRTGEDNRSAGVKKVISALGARINDKLLRDTTHVVFKDGLLSTYKKAKNWDIPIVSILWIEACKTQHRICDPKQYPISNVDRYENPELYEKIKRHKSMQPDAEANKRIRHKPGTPKNATPKITTNSPKSNTKSTKKTSKIVNNSTTPKKTDISKYFKPVDKKASNKQQHNARDKTPATPHVDSPATRLLNRMTANGFTPVRKLTKKMDGIDLTEDVSNDIPSYTGGAAAKHATPKKVKKTLEFNGTAADDQQVAMTPTQRTRRRSTTLTAPNMTITITPKSARKQIARHEIASIREETSADDEQAKDNNSIMNVTDTSHKTRRRTTYTAASINVDTPTDEANNNIALTSNTNTGKLLGRRRTLFTPQQMELTHTQQCSTADDSSFDDALSHVSSSTTLTGVEMDEKLNNTNTPDTMKTLLEEQAATLIFSSTRDPRSRRTLFDVGMDIITQRMQNINRSARRSLAVTNSLGSLDERRGSPEKGEIGNVEIAKSVTTPDLPSQLAAQQLQQRDECTPNVVKKRKLFMPLDDSLIQLTPPVANVTVAAVNTTTPNTLSGVKKRRTLMPATPDCIALAENTAKAKTSARKARRSTLLFEAPQTPAPVEQQTTKQTNSARTRKSITKPKKTNNHKDKAAAGDVVDKDDRKVLVYTNMHTEQITKLREALTALGGFRLEYSVDDTTTHVVTLEPRRTINMLRALVRGLWIISYHWVEESMRIGKWLNEERYEMQDFSRAVKICRAERQAFGNTYRCELFVNIGAFYVTSRCGPVSKENLRELITDCGGKVVQSRQFAKYVLCDRNKNADEKIYVTPYWVLDCITQMQLLNYQKYIIPSEVQRPRFCFQPYQSHSKVLKALQVTHTDFAKMAGQLDMSKKYRKL